MATNVRGTSEINTTGVCKRLDWVDFPSISKKNKMVGSTNVFFEDFQPDMFNQVMI